MSELFGGAGIPDAWQRLWAPHRMEYLTGDNRPLPGNEIECPFCRIPTLSDEDGLIVARGKEAYVVMNLYPYNAGHLLVCAYRHVELESADEHKTLVSEFRDEFLIAIDQMGPDAFAAGLLFPAIPLDFNTGLGIKEITEYIDQL